MAKSYIKSNSLLCPFAKYRVKIKKPIARINLNIFKEKTSVNVYMQLALVGYGVYCNTVIQDHKA